MGKRASIAAAAVLVAAVAIAGTWTVRRNRPAATSVALTGTIEARQIDVSPKLTGRIVELAVREGQPVERGQLIARLEPSELAADVRRAEAAVRTAEAQLRDLRAGARREEIEQARAQVRNTEATRVWTERDLQRTRELYAKELVAAQDVDRARQAYGVAVANEASAKEHLDLVRAGPRPDAVAAAQHQVTEAQESLALARARLGEARLVSPVTGVVLHKNTEAGETVNPGISIVTLMNPQDIWLRAFVPETDIGRIKIGQPATITVDAYPGRKFDGVVSEIGSEAEYTPRNVQTKKERVNLVFRIKIAVRNPDGTLKPGMPADADIPLQ